MKKIIPLGLFFIQFSCNQKVDDKSFDTSKATGVTKILATYINVDGTKRLDVLIRQINEKVLHDSINGKSFIGLDTIWAYPVNVPLIDSLNNQILDSNNQPKMSLQYMIISKDSVNWKVENISIDSLLK